MTEVSDETLMMFADGVLAPHDRDRVQRLIAKAPDLKARVDMFRMTGPGLARLFDDHVDAPIPARLLEAAAGPKHERTSNILTGNWKRAAPSARGLPGARRFPASWNAATALAASLAIVIGVGLGWLLRGATGDHETAASQFASVEGQRLLARGPLERALEAASSGKAVPVALADGEAILQIKMTFRNEAGDYCRQYDIAAPTHERFAGIACRADGRWSVTMQTLLPPSSAASARTVPAGAGNNSAVDAAIGAMIEGDAVVGDEEAAIIRGGWRK